LSIGEFLGDQELNACGGGSNNTSIGGAGNGTGELSTSTSASNMSSSSYCNKIDLDKAHFILLGHVTMSRNDSTGFKARELKSISVECRGSLVKLLIQNNYTNKYNRNQQVSSL
jgi:hypothetical protein